MVQAGRRAGRGRRAAVRGVDRQGRLRGARAGRRACSPRSSCPRATPSRSARASRSSATAPARRAAPRRPPSPRPRRRHRRRLRAAAPPRRPPAPPPRRPRRLPPPAPRRPGAAARARAGSGARARRRRPAGRVTSPLVRRLIAEHGLDPAAITGTGEGGRDHPPRRRGARSRPAPDAPGAAPAPARGRRRARRRVRAGDERVPFDNIRRRTAEHMVRSKATSAHVYTSVEVDFERVERVRRAPRRVDPRRGGLRAHVPAVHRPRVLRRRARLPERERERRRRHARRAPRRQPRHRGRPAVQGSDRAGDPRRRRQAAPPDRP